VVLRQRNEQPCRKVQKVLTRSTCNISRKSGVRTREQMFYWADGNRR
jgi:hypothetical protein